MQTGFAAPRARIDLELETRKKVNLAIADFVVKGVDVMGIAKEAKLILKRDLELSEWFSPLQETVFEELEKMERSTSKVDYRSWRQVGAQWLIKTEFSDVANGKGQVLTFRLYDAVNKRFLLGKRYKSSRDLLRKTVHRFADEVVLQLTRLEKPKRKPVVTKPVKSVSEETFRELESLKNKKINEVKAVAPAPLQEDILKNFDELKMEKSLIETPSKEIPKKSPIKPVPEKKKLQKTVVPEDDLLKELQQLAMLGSSPASEVKSREREPQTSAQKSSESFNSLADKFSSLSVESEPVKVEVSSARLDSSSFQSKLRSLPKPSRTRTESSTGDSFVLAKKDGVPGADIQSLYVGMIKEKIFKNWREPLAQEHNQETVVSFYIFPKGNADKPVIKKSSGVEALDTLAVRAILDSVPFPEFPEGLKASNLHLEMYFKYVPKED